MSDLTVKSDKIETLTPKQASRILRVNPKTLKRWSKNNKIRSITLPSGHSRYYRDDILAIGTKNIVKESKKDKLSLLSIIVLFWIWFKGLFK